MDLSREISLSSLFKKKDKAKKGGKTQLKTYINFAEIEEKKDTNWALAIPGIIIILALAFILGKFGVADRFAALSKKQSEASALQARLDEDMAIISGGDELSDKYYHYTWSGLTDEELNRVSRVDVAELVNFINAKGVAVSSLSVRGTQLTVEITADSLQTISSLTRELDQREIVQSCSMASAQTREEAVAETSETQAVSEDEIQDDTANLSLSTAVDAMINIYLRDDLYTNDAEAEQQ